MDDIDFAEYNTGIIKALLIPAEMHKEVTEVEVDLNNMTEVIGAINIEYVRTIFEDVRLVVDEIGRLIDRPFNLRATAFYKGGIVGDALLIGWTDEPTHVAERFKGML